MTVKYKGTETSSQSLPTCKGTELQTHHKFTPNILGSCDTQSMEVYSVGGSTR